MGAPAAQRAPARPPVPGLLGTPDRCPERLDLALGGEQVAPRRGCSAAPRRCRGRSAAASRAPRRGCARGPARRTSSGTVPWPRTPRRGAAGLVVDHPDLARRGDVEPVDEAAQQQLGVEQRLDVDLPLGRLEPRRVLEREVAGERPPGRRPARPRPRAPRRRTSPRSPARPRGSAPTPAPAGRPPAPGCARRPAGRRGPRAPCAPRCRGRRRGRTARAAGRRCGTGTAADSVMKSPARLGDSEPSTSTPSTPCARPSRPPIRSAAGRCRGPRRLRHRRCDPGHGGDSPRRAPARAPVPRDSPRCAITAPGRPPGTLASGRSPASTSWSARPGCWSPPSSRSCWRRPSSAEPGLGGLTYVAGLAFAVLLYLSVLLHEASHALMAQRFGLPSSRSRCTSSAASPRSRASRTPRAASSASRWWGR